MWAWVAVPLLPTVEMVFGRSPRIPNSDAQSLFHVTISLLLWFLHFSAFLQIYSQNLSFCFTSIKLSQVPGSSLLPEVALGEADKSRRRRGLGAAR